MSYSPNHRRPDECDYHRREHRWWPRRTAEIEVELTYDNGGTTTISLGEQACTASLDRAGVGSLAELIGQPWSTLLPALEQQGDSHARSRHP